MATNLKMVSGVNHNYRELVYKIVCKIPNGKVATYGQIAEKFKILNLKFKIDPRIVGWALHANRDPKVPCHRVVDRDGKIAKNFAFGGAEEQRKRLIGECVKFKDAMHVDLEFSLANLSSELN